MTTRLRYVPALVVMVTIFIFSHTPGDQLHTPSFLDFDKFWHALEYSILALTLLYAIRPTSIDLGPYLLVFVFCLLYGITDEFHQSFIPLRTPSFWDVCADGFGALLTVLAINLVNRRRFRI